MLEPQCDTMSFYLNSNSGLATWVAWSWRAYLSLDNNLYLQKTTNKNGRAISYYTYNDFVMYGSNHEIYKQSTILKNNPEMKRLCEPKIGITAEMSFDNAPIFLILTSSGDPLRDDGLQFGAILKKYGAKVQMIEAMSSHCAGMTYDSSFKKNIIKAWRDLIFES